MIDRSEFADRDKVKTAIENTKIAYEAALRTKVTDTDSILQMARLETQMVWASICEALLQELEVVENFCRARYETDGEIINGLRTRLETLEGQLGVASYTTMG